MDQVEQTLFILRSTVPATIAGNIDYFYGDQRELLSIAQSNLVQIRNLCRNTANVDSAACQDSKMPFPLGFPNYFHPLDMSVQLLGMYGLAGDVTVSTIDRRPDSETTGQVIQTSLISTSSTNSFKGQPAVQYCTALPKTLYDIPYPAYIDFYKGYMASISSNCQATLVRSSPQQQVCDNQYQEFPQEMFSRDYFLPFCPMTPFERFHFFLFVYSKHLIFL